MIFESKILLNWIKRSLSNRQIAISLMIIQGDSHW